MKGYPILLAISCIQVLSAAIFPGPCPISPPSDTITDHDFTVIGKVPFSKYVNSYLFGNRVKESCEIKFRPDNTFVYHEDSRQFCPVIEGSFDRFNGKNGSYLLMAIQSHGRGCLLQIKSGIVVSEIISIFLHGKGAFLWSCQELLEIESHDQGLLVLMDSNYQNRYENFSESLTEMKSAIKGYFEKAFIDQVYWEKINDLKSAFCKSTSVCMPPISTIRNDVPAKTYYVVIVVAILFLCILVLFSYINLPPFICTDNRVYPLQ